MMGPMGTTKNMTRSTNNSTLHHMNLYYIIPAITVLTLVLLGVFYVSAGFVFVASDLWYLYGCWVGSVTTVSVIKYVLFPKEDDVYEK